MSRIYENLQCIRNQIQQSCTKVKRSPNEILLVAATKGVSDEKILEVSIHGIVDFGENRVQEATEKISKLPSRLKWHMIGHLQSNKTKVAANLFNMIQSVDSIKLAERLQGASTELGKIIEVLLEVNIGKEETKFGFLEEDVERVLDQIRKWSGLKVRGLMTVAPLLKDSEEVRPYFRKMNTLFHRLEGLEILSMGMSHDYPIAIEEGATMIRLGQAIFGSRKP
jgi:pyridoxal phosphate enzyme (YggS family)